MWTRLEIVWSGAGEGSQPDIPKLLEGEQLQSMLGRGSARCWYKHSCKKKKIGKLTSKSVSPKNEKNNLHCVWAYGTDLSACLQVPLPLCETQNTCIPHPGLQCPPTPHTSLSVGWCCCWRALCYASTYVCSQPVLLACPPGEDQVRALAEFSTSGDQF